MDSNLSRLYFMLEKYDNEQQNTQHCDGFDQNNRYDIPLNDPTVMAKCGNLKPIKLDQCETDSLLDVNDVTNSTVVKQPSIMVIELAKQRITKESIDINALPSKQAILHSNNMDPILDHGPIAATLDITSSTTIVPKHNKNIGNTTLTNNEPTVRCRSSNENTSFVSSKNNFPAQPRGPILSQDSSSTTQRGHKLDKEMNCIQPSVELHFNPLYTISDGGGETISNPIISNAAFCNRNELTEIDQHLPSHPRMINPQFLLFGQSFPPKDEFSFIYISLVLAGIGFLLPYNSFVIASDYFQHRFPSTTIVFDMSTTYILVAFGTVFVNNIVIELIPLFWRLNIGYLLSFVIMFIVLFYEIWAKLGDYVSNLIFIGIVSVGCTIQQSSFYGYTSMLPKKYIQAVMAGESAAGIVMSANRIITKLLYPNDEQYNTCLFFVISIVVILCCALIHITILPRSNFIRYHMWLCNNRIRDGHSHNETLHHRRRRSTNVDANEAASRMMDQINENLGLVQMYDRRAEERLSNMRPSIYSTGSSLIHIDCFDTNSTDPSMNVTSSTQPETNNRIERLLRTDSTEFVLPFGIDDEELASVEREQLHQSRVDSQLDNVPLNHQNSTADTSMSDDFKSTTTVSRIVAFLAWFENLTNLLQSIRIIFRRIQRCLHLRGTSLNRIYNSLSEKLSIRRVIIGHIWPHMFTIMLVYFVTLIIFPGIESEIYSCRFNEWMPIILMACFNLFDFIGKLLSTCFYRVSNYQMLGIAFIRFLLLPAMTLCVEPRIPEPFFSNPFWPILFTCILGVTNGIFGSLPMILAPVEVQENKREIAGNLMTFSYIIGLTTGSLMSYRLHDYITNDHPPHSPDSHNWNCMPYQLHYNSNQYSISTVNETTNQPSNATDAIQTINTTNLARNVSPELLKNTTMFSSTFYHF